MKLFNFISNNLIFYLRWIAESPVVFLIDAIGMLAFNIICATLENIISFCSLMFTIFSLFCVHCFLNIVSHVAFNFT